MRILNLRLGFACNSSSSHSVVIFDPAIRPKHDSGLDTDTDFGWGNFTLASKTAKRRYAFSAMMVAATRVITSRMTANGKPPPWESTEASRAATDAWEAEHVRGVLEVLKRYGWDEPTLPPWTDHQSILTVPSTFDGHGLLTPFVERFIKFFEREDVTVLGGNDNDYSHPLGNRFDKQMLRALPVESAMRGRFDKTHFVLFGDVNGTKLRVTFDEDVDAVPTLPLRALTPELVDVKLTDFCTKGCTYCYQGSTPKGRHAPTEQVLAILEALAANHVFEVAFGGGEPTEHPDFFTILKHTRQLKMVPNFTTRNIDFLRQHREELFDPSSTYPHSLVGAVAISIDNVAQMQLAAERLFDAVLEPATARDNVPYVRCSPSPAGQRAAHRIQWQVVHGAVDTAELKALHASPFRMYRPLLLLGWKTTGRGASVAPKACNWESLTSEGVLYIDTEFQRQFGDRLRELGALSETMGAPEGTFSMYIDAVSGLMGPSSYCAKKLMRPFEPFPSREFIREAWDMLSVDDGEKWAQGGLL